MNPVLNLSRTYAVPADELWAILMDRRGDWWGEGDPTPKKIDAPAKLSLEVGDGTLAILLLQQSQSGTELSVLHSRFASAEDRDAEEPRWAERMQRLAALLAS